MVNRIDIVVGARGDFSQLNAQIAQLKAAVAELQSKPLLGDTGRAAAAQIAQVQTQFDKMLLATRAFNVESVKMSNAIDKFGERLQAGQLHFSEYARIYRQTTKGMRTELDALSDSQARLAKSVVLPDALKSGYARVITNLTSDLKSLNAAEEAAIIKTRALNTVIHGMGTSLVNMGKNTQWAGRQLTVGLTVPVAAFGAMAAKVFKEVNIELTRMQRMYGTGLTLPDPQEIAGVSKQIIDLSETVAKNMGIAQKETVFAAANFAAVGTTGQALVTATEQAMRLSKLGAVNADTAQKTITSLQTTFRVGTKDVAEAVNFLNDIQKQTSTDLQDLTDAIPRVGPIVAQLGGTYKDTAVMMVAMKEAGVPAAQSANAIKSAVASLIGPTRQATDEFNKYGISLTKIKDDTQGNPIKMIESLQTALQKLSPLVQAQLIEKLFGKFQFARVTALINNLGRAGSQTENAFKVAKASVGELAALADSEMKIATESTTAKWQRALEGFKSTLLPLGEKFMKFGTKVLNVFEKIIEFLHKFKPFENLLVNIIGGAAIIGPVLMLVGLFGNLVGSIIKGVNYFRMFAQGAKDGGIVNGFKNMANFFEMINIETLASSKNMDGLTTSTQKTVEAFAILNSEIGIMTKSLNEIFMRGNRMPIIASPLAQQTLAELQAVNPMYVGGATANIERPHMFPAARLWEGWVANEENIQGRYPTLNAFLQNKALNPDITAQESWMKRGTPDQWGAPVPSGGLAAQLQQEFKKEDVIYGPKFGVSKEDVYSRGFQKIEDIRNRILDGRIAADSKVAVELAKIDSLPEEEKTKALSSVIQKVTFTEEQYFNNLIESLVQTQALLTAPEDMLKSVDAKVKTVLADPTIENKSVAIQAILTEFNADFKLLGGTVVEEITKYRALVEAAILNAKTSFETAITAANFRAGIVAEAEMMGGIRKSALGRFVSMDKQALSQSLLLARDVPKGFQTGGAIHAQDGVWVPGTGSGDRVPAMLEPGEFVVNRNAAKQYGGLLEHLNWKAAPRFGTGGDTGLESIGIKGYARGTDAKGAKPEFKLSKYVESFMGRLLEGIRYKSWIGENLMGFTRGENSFWSRLATDNYSPLRNEILKELSKDKNISKTSYNRIKESFETDRALRDQELRKIAASSLDRVIRSGRMDWSDFSTAEKADMLVAAKMESLRKYKTRTLSEINPNIRSVLSILEPGAKGAGAPTWEIKSARNLSFWESILGREGIRGLDFSEMRARSLSVIDPEFKKLLSSGKYSDLSLSMRDLRPAFQEIHASHIVPKKGSRPLGLFDYDLVNYQGMLRSPSKFFAFVRGFVRQKGGGIPGYAEGGGPTWTARGLPYSMEDFQQGMQSWIEPVLHGLAPWNSPWKETYRPMGERYNGFYADIFNDQMQTVGRQELMRAMIADLTKGGKNMHPWITELVRASKDLYYPENFVGTRVPAMKNYQGPWVAETSRPFTSFSQIMDTTFLKERFLKKIDSKKFIDAMLKGNKIPYFLHAMTGPETRGLPISDLFTGESYYGNEKEFVLPQGQKLPITGYSSDLATKLPIVHSIAPGSSRMIGGIRVPVAQTGGLLRQRGGGIPGYQFGSTPVPSLQNITDIGIQEKIFSDYIDQNLKTSDTIKMLQSEILSVATPEQIKMMTYSEGLKAMAENRKIVDILEKYTFSAIEHSLFPGLPTQTSGLSLLNTLGLNERFYLTMVKSPFETWQPDTMLSTKPQSSLFTKTLAQAIKEQGNRMGPIEIAPENLSLSPYSEKLLNNLIKRGLKIRESQMVAEGYEEPYQKNNFGYTDAKSITKTRLELFLQKMITEQYNTPHRFGSLENPMMKLRQIDAMPRIAENEARSILMGWLKANTLARQKGGGIPGFTQGLTASDYLQRELTGPGLPVPGVSSGPFTGTFETISELGNRQNVFVKTADLHTMGLEAFINQLHRALGGSGAAIDQVVSKFIDADLKERFVLRSPLLENLSLYDKEGIPLENFNAKEGIRRYIESILVGNRDLHGGNFGFVNGITTITDSGEHFLQQAGYPLTQKKTAEQIKDFFERVTSPRVSIMQPEIQKVSKKALEVLAARGIDPDLYMKNIIKEMQSKISEGFVSDILLKSSGRNPQIIDALNQAMMIHQDKPFVPAMTDLLKTRAKRMSNPFFSVRLQSGGSAWVPGVGDGDRVPAMLEPGEFVINKKAAKQYGGLLQDINFNKAPRFAEGGFNRMVDRVTPTGINTFGQYTKIMASMIPNVATQMAKDFAMGLKMSVSPKTYQSYNPLSAADAAGVKLANASHLLPAYLSSGVSAFKTGMQNPDVAFKNVPEHFNRLNTIAVNAGAAIRTLGDFAKSGAISIKDFGKNLRGGIGSFKTGIQNPSYLGQIPAYFNLMEKFGYTLGALLTKARESYSSGMTVRQGYNVAKGSLMVPTGEKETTYQPIMQKTDSGFVQARDAEGNLLTEAKQTDVMRQGNLKDIKGLRGKIGYAWGKQAAGGMPAMMGGQMAGMAGMQMAQGMREGTAKSALSGASMGAMMGAMTPLGPIGGAAIGAIASGAYSMYKQHQQKLKDAASFVKDSLNMSTIAMQHLGITARDLSSIVIDSSGKVSKGSAEYQQKVSDYKNAQDEDTKNAIQGLKDKAAAGDITGIQEIINTRMATAYSSLSDPNDPEVRKKVLEDQQAFLASADIGFKTRQKILGKTPSSTPSNINSILDNLNLRIAGQTVTSAKTMQGLTLPGTTVFDKDQMSSVLTQFQTKTDPKQLGLMLEKSTTQVKMFKDAMKTSGNEVSGWGILLQNIKKIDPELEKLDKQYSKYIQDGTDIIRINNLMASGIDQITVSQAKLIATSAKNFGGVSILSGLEKQQSQINATNSSWSDWLSNAEAYDAQQTDSSTAEKLAAEALENKRNHLNDLIEKENEYTKGKQKAIDAIQKEMSARDKLVQSEDRQIQREQTLLDLRAGITRAAGSGDLIALAQAQNAYNVELGKQADLKKKEAQDAADESRIKSLQDAIDRSTKRVDSYNKSLTALDKQSAASTKTQSNHWNVVSGKAHTARDASLKVRDAVLEVGSSTTWTSLQDFQEQVLAQPGIKGNMDKADISTQKLKQKIVELYNSFGGDAAADANARLQETGDMIKKIQDDTERALATSIYQQTYSAYIAAHPGKTVTTRQAKVWAQNAKSAAESYVAASSGTGRTVKNGKPQEPPFSVPKNGTQNAWYRDPDYPNWYWQLGANDSWRNQGAQTAKGTKSPGKVVNDWEAKANGGLLKLSSGFGPIGGIVVGPGGPRDDLIPTMLSDGEYVIQASMVSKYGASLMDAINNGTFNPSFNLSGAKGTSYSLSNSNTSTQTPFNDNSVYNINVSVDSNANPDDIAKAVMKAIDRQKSTVSSGRSLGGF